MSDRIRTVDMSNPDVVLVCYRLLDVAYKELKAENAKLRAALKPFADTYTNDGFEYSSAIFKSSDLRAAAAALRETGDE